MVVNRSRRCSYRRLLPIWLTIFSIASCYATEAPYQNHNDEKMQFESEIDVRAEVLSSTQAYDQLGVEPSNLRTELLVSEATEVTQTLSSSDDSVTSTIRQLSSETVVEYEDRVNDGSYKRSEAEELIIGTTEQFRHSEINEKQTAAQDSIGVTITATADDSSVTTSTSTATSTSTEDDIMLYSNADVNCDINTLRQNTRPSSNLSHSNDKEELVHDMAVDTTVDPMPIDTLIIKNTYNDDNTHKRTLNNDSDIDDDDNDNGNDDDSSTSNSSDINSINTKEIQSDHKSNLQTEREIITDDDYIDEVVEGAVVNDGDVDVDDGKNDNLKNHDSVNIEGKHRIGSDNRVSNGIKNDDNNNENNTNSDKNDHYDDEYEGDDDMNNDSKKDDDHDSGTNKNTNQESSSSDNDDHSYTDYHDTDTTTDNDDYSDSNDISIDNNNNDDSTNNKNIDDDNDVKNTIGTSSTHNNTSTNNHINSNKNTNTRTKTNTKTNEEVSHTALSASLNSRIKRLSILMKERKDLVDDYNIHQMGKETIMNAMNRHIMKSMQHRPLLPSSDSACSWNYWKERCEPVCVCSWQYKFGDIHPGRSCRALVNASESGSGTDGPLLTRDTAIDPQCDSGILVPGPIRIAVTSILSFFQSAKKLIFKLERNVRFQTKEKVDLLVIASPTLSQNVA